jgi:hypothetical protein
VLCPPAESIDQRLNRRRLIAHGLIGVLELKDTHGCPRPFILARYVPKCIYANHLRERITAIAGEVGNEVRTAEGLAEIAA